MHKETCDLKLLFEVIYFEYTDIISSNIYIYVRH